MVIGDCGAGTVAIKKEGRKKKCVRKVRGGGRRGIKAEREVGGVRGGDGEGRFVGKTNIRDGVGAESIRRGVGRGDVEGGKSREGG